MLRIRSGVWIRKHVTREGPGTQKRTKEGFYYLIFILCRSNPMKLPFKPDEIIDSKQLWVATGLKDWMHIHEVFMRNIRITSPTGRTHCFTVVWRSCTWSQIQTTYKAIGKSLKNYLRNSFKVFIFIQKTIHVVKVWLEWWMSSSSSIQT